jgi:hypothetical protein
LFIFIELVEGLGCVLFIDDIDATGVSQLHVLLVIDADENLFLQSEHSFFN